MLTREITIRVGLVLLILCAISLFLTVYFVRWKFEDYVENDVNALKSMIVSTLHLTSSNTNVVEKVSDLTMYHISKRITQTMQGRPVSQITKQELRQLAKQMDVEGISLFVPFDDHFIVVRSSEDGEIGLSTQHWGFWNVALRQLYERKPVSVGHGFAQQNYWAGPISKAAWNESYYKFVYYYDGSTPFIVNPYVRDDRIYQFTDGMGPDALIDELIAQNPVIKEIAIINIKPYLKGRLNRVIQPNLERPILYGTNQYTFPEEWQLLNQLLLDGKERKINFRQDLSSLVKLYVPIQGERALTVVVDNSRYKKLELAIITVVISSFILAFILINVIVRSIAHRRLRPLQEIEAYITEVATGNFAARMNILEQNELGRLAVRIGDMGHKLGHLVAQLNARAEERINHLAYYDELTDLPNRRFFKEAINHKLLEAKQSNDTFAVMFLDLDRFKKVNDSLGHSAGDKLLGEVVHRIKTAVRPTDVLARLGGDEFAILVSPLTAKEEVECLAQAVITCLQDPFVIDDHEFSITGSIGIALYPRDGQDESTLLKNADTAMYGAKENGKNNYQFYHLLKNQLSLNPLKMENDLAKALRQDDLFLLYQPRVNLSTGDVIGAEALLRWQHRDLGLVMPQDFIPLAEESGLIAELDEWVLRRVARQLASWQAAGHQPQKVAVNISAMQFWNMQIVDKVAGILQEHQIEPQWLELEITESTLMKTSDRTVGTLQKLHDLGIRIAIDDFGTGYSSLGYLKEFPVQYLKIDKSFVQDMVRNPNDRAIVSSVITLAHNLGMKVVAEGVETREQMERLATYGCDEIQGYLISKPLDAEQYQLFLRRSGRFTDRIAE